MVPRKRNRLFLGRFKGVCKGDRAPTRIQRSDSCGKRRNNGTDDACPPQAADRMRDVEFVPTQLPLDDSFFRPSTALSFSYEKESAVETVRSHALCCAKKKGLNVSGPARDFLSEASARLKAYRVYVEAEQRTSGRKDPSWDHMKAKIAFTHRYVI